MGNILKELPDGDYVTNEPKKKVVSELPAGDYTTERVVKKIPKQDFVPTADNNEQIEKYVKMVEDSSRGPLIDTDRDALRGVLKNPNSTPEQIKETISTIQGLHPKHSEDSTLYYMKQDDNGVIVPKALAYGEKPPRGYNVASVWGAKEDANDDAWYTDLSKSLYNGVMGAVQGVVNVAQLGSLGASGEESKYLNKIVNTAEALKFEKDAALDKPLFNTEGIKEFADLADSKRYDFSPDALWGTLNMAAESVTSFLLGAKGAGVLIKGGKGLSYGLRGVEEAVTLGKVGQRAAAFTGSYLTQVGENMDAAKEAGLEGRDIFKVASMTTALQATIDAAIGLEAHIFYGLQRKGATDLLRGLARTVEKDAAGNITRKGFQDLATSMSTNYAKLASSGVTSVLKGSGREMTHETLQGVIAKSGENLWDKLSDEDKAKFGTDAVDAKSFGSYIQNGLAGLVSGAPMSMSLNKIKSDYNAQSINAYEVVQRGEGAIKELKENLKLAFDKGELTSEEFNKANFRIDTYLDYNNQINETAGKDLNNEEKRKAFDLSFQISGIRTEIPTEKSDLDKLSPIQLAEINSKKDIVKGLQKELDDILKKKNVETEPVVAAQTLSEVEAKDNEYEEEGTIVPEKEDVISKEDRSALQSELDGLYENWLNTFSNRREQLLTEGKTEQEATDIVEQLWYETEKGKRALEIEKQLAPKKEGKVETKPKETAEKPVEKKTEKVPVSDNTQINTGDRLTDINGKSGTVTSVDIGKGGSRQITMKMDNGATMTANPKVVELFKEVEVAPYVEKSDRRKNAPKFDAKDQSGNFEFNKQKPLEKKEIIHDYLDANPQLNNELEGHIEQGQNNKWHVNIGGRFVQFARNIIKDKYTGDYANFPLGRKQITDTAGNKLFRYDKPVGIKLMSITSDNGGRKRVLSIYNKQTGKHIVFVQEKEKGVSNYSPNEIKQLNDIQNLNHLTAESEKENPVFTESQVSEPLPSQSTKEQFIEQGIAALKANNQYDPALDKIYRSQLSKQYEKQNKPTESEISESEREQLIESGYDNTTIDKAIKKANELLRLPVKELFNELKKLGIFNIGDTSVWRPDLGLTAKEFIATVRQFETNKDTKTVEKVSAFIQGIKDTGLIKMIGLTGWMTERASLPLYQFVLEEKSGERGLTAQEEKEFLDQEAARKQAEDEGQYQKQANVKAIAEKVQAVIKHLQKMFPKVKIVHNPNLTKDGKPAAARVVGNTIEVNPYGAGIDTPIHEYGHILIDAIGYNNKVIQAAIKQLQGTPLWDEIAARYPELSPEMLGKEVLAEAIGREGAGIFDKVADQSKFKTFLDYIFDWLKTKLGLNKNIAKSLAKQIIGGVGTKELTGTNEAAQYQLLSDIHSAADLANFTQDDLIVAYNDALQAHDSELRTDVMQRIAYHFNETQKELLRKNNNFLEKEANKKDLKWREVQFKVLSHMTQNFPELQKLSPLFDAAYLDKITEANSRKKEFETLAKAVMNEYNKKIGIVKRVAGMLPFNSNTAKYFEFLDDNGKLRTNTKGLSAAQIAFLNKYKELVALKAKQVDENGNEIQDDILKIDKGFAETFKTEGMMAALSNYFGGSNLADVEVTYTNPNTGTREMVAYSEAQKAILDYSKKGLTQKGIALAKLLQIAYKAKKDSGKSAYAINYKGQLTNKFDKPRPKDMGYSKDFYRAVQLFIDGYTHTKHMSKFVPIVNSLDYLYSQGYGDVLAKPNAKKWLEEWSQVQIYQTEKTTDPIIDNSLKFLRTLTSQIIMGFAYGANVMNLGIGLYNTWRQENIVTVLKGMKRLFGKGGLNKYGIDLVAKYKVVNLDIDSYPEFRAGKLFQRAAFGGQQWGEFLIQSSAFLGKLDEKEWNSNEYNSKGELVAKSKFTESELNKKMEDIKTEISNVQGKYNPKDRRNFARGELGKNLQQFKTWMPDWWRMRYGAEYIDKDGVLRRGSWNMFTQAAMEEIKADFSKANNYGFKMVNGVPMIRNKQIAANLRGAMAVAFMLVMAHGDDDDEKKRKKISAMRNALGNLLFIFDVDQMKYTLKNPVAGMGTLNKFLEILEDVWKMDADEFAKDAKKVIPMNKALDVPSQTEEMME